MLDINKIKDLIKTSFKEVYDLRENFDNTKRSSRFVTVLSEKIHQYWFKDKKLNVQKIYSNGKKESGEWLYDMCITEQKEIKDIKYPGSKALINTKILFAMECEFSTSIKEFCQDFGKLLCSAADQLLFIQGLNQTTDEGRTDFIERRKRTIEKYFCNFGKDFYLAFVSSPEKIRNNNSYWDFLKSTEEWIKVFYFNKDGKFIG